MTVPATTIQDTALRASDFAKAHIKAAFLSILPYALACQLLNSFGMPDHQIIAFIGFAGSFYIYSLFSAHLHRAFISGAAPGPVRLLQPAKDDWRFIGMFFALILISAGIFVGVIFVFGAALHLAGVVAGLLAMLFLFPFLVRLLIMLPDRAAGGRLSIRQTLLMTDGLFWGIFLSPLVAGWRIGLAAAIYVAATSFLASRLALAFFPAMADPENMAFQSILFVIQMPVVLGAQYWLTALVAAGLSNYYLLAKEKQQTAA